MMSHFDPERKPEMIPAQLGQRQISFMALVERIEQQFDNEYADTETLQQAQTQAERLKLLLGIVDYVLATESVRLDNEAKASLIRTVYSGLFGYGPLDDLLTDSRITTISLQGADGASVRYGHGDLETLPPLFEDEQHLTRIMRRLLLDAGADLSDDVPYIETGLMIGERRVALNLITPMLAFGYSVDIRLHPVQPVTLGALVDCGFVTTKVADLLVALAQSPYGLIVVGDTESSKTTLLSVLAQYLPADGQIVAVERAAEMHLPEHIKRLTVTWPMDDVQGVTFGEQIINAARQQPDCLLLDEVRADEPEMIRPLLADDNVPRQIWSFRGPFDAKRLRNALGMLARRADMAQAETLVNRLYQRLPFIVTVWRIDGQLRLYSIAEWQYQGSDYPEYVPLVETVERQLRLTGTRPMHDLSLPDTFWAGDNPQT